MNALRQYGYTLLSMPATDVRPLALLLKTGNGIVEKLNAPLKDLFQPVNMAPPAVSKDVEMPQEFSKEEDMNLKIDANFSFLKGLIAVFSGKSAADFSLDKMDHTHFKLNDPRKSYVNIIKLDSFIQDAAVNTTAKSILERLQDNELYVVTEVVQANSFTLEEAAHTHVSAGVEAPVKGVVEAKAGVDAKSEQSNVIKSKEGSYYTIAIKAYQILYDKPSLFSLRPEGFRIREAKDIKIVRGEEEYPANKLEDELIEVKGL